MEYWCEEPFWFEFINDPETLKSIKAMRCRFKKNLADPRYAKYASSLEQAPAVSASKCDFNSDTITIGSRGDLDKAQNALLKAALAIFCPWKKGPFNIFGEYIDSEWQSQLKWNRLLPYIGSLENKIVADIGCHNGYYMYRMLPLKPRAVLGFEPVAKHWFNFHLIQKYTSRPELAFELFGVEHLDLFPETFDVIFCMGILYHHTDPISLLRKMRHALKKKGQIIIDCQGIPGDEEFALVPRGRYAGAKGIWFLPTLKCLINWIQRSGMQAQAVYSAPLLPEEQRATPWANIKSLKDFLTEDQSRTIEGYPAPHRFYLIAKK